LVARRAVIRHSNSAVAVFAHARLSVASTFART
jgi:hypothetical protein